jgi:hypothetical protein
MNAQYSQFDLVQVSGLKHKTLFCAGVIFKDLKYHRAAPILRGYLGLKPYFTKFRTFALKKGWTVIHVSTWTSTDVHGLTQVAGSYKSVDSRKAMAT